MANKEALWVQLMRAKYKCRDMVLFSLNTRSGSRLWKGLASVWGDMRQNVVWCWGNEHDISFWYDTRIGDLGPLAQHTLSVVDSVLARATVSDMVDDRGRWLWEKFHGFLPMYVLMHMDVVKGPTRYLLSDNARWRGCEDNLFTINMAYNMCVGVVDQRVESHWRIIYKFCGIHHICIFLWLACCNKLMTNEEQYFARDAKDWDLMFEVVVWNIWIQRNAMQGDDVIAYGGAIRDDVGGWQRGFPRLIGVVSVVEAELWAIYDGLLMD
ncbi:hypothetical protein GQ457_17G014650 [Hibiscus cannabinus]